MMKAAN